MHAHDRRIDGATLSVLAALGFCLVAMLAAAGTASAAFPGDNGKIAFVKYVNDVEPNAWHGQIETMLPNGTGITNLSRSHSNDVDPAWSPDGTHLAFASDRDHNDGSFDIYTMTADGLDVTRLTTGGGNRFPSWSPDGTKVVFATSSSIVKMDAADGGNKTTLAVGGPLGAPSWSADNTRIAFVRGRNDVYTMDIDGGNQAKLETVGTNDFPSTIWTPRPDWSPDGSVLAYSYETEGPSGTSDRREEIRFHNFTGSGPLGGQIFVSALYPGFLAPAWSPDGTKVMTQRSGSGGTSLYIGDWEDFHAWTGTDTGVSGADPDWQPLKVGHHPPIASFTAATYSPQPGQPIQFTSTATDDGSIASQSWDFDEDGVFTDATGGTPTHALTAPGQHSVWLRVVDNDGMTDAAEMKFNVAQLPQAYIDNQLDDVDGNDLTVAFTGSGNVTGFKCSFAEGDTASTDFSDCTSPFSENSLDDGDYTFVVRPSNGYVNGEDIKIVYTVDTVPDTTIDSGPDVTSDRTPEFTFSADKETTGFECRLDDDDFEPCDSPYTTPTLPDGDYDFEVRATGINGITDPTPDVWSFRVDNVPDTAITSGPPNSTASGEATFTFTTTEPGAGFACQRDGGPWTACSSPWVLTGVAPGSHSFQVRSYDSTGNTDPSPAAAFWLVTGSPAPAPTPVAKSKCTKLHGTARKRCNALAKCKKLKGKKAKRCKAKARAIGRKSK